VPPEGRRIPSGGSVNISLTCLNSLDGLKLVWDHLLGNLNLDEWNLPTLGSSSIIGPYSFMNINVHSVYSRYDSADQ
jgi:hypothetical protein